MRNSKDTEVNKYWKQRLILPANLQHVHAVCLICDCYVSYIFQSSKYDWLMIDLIMKIKLKKQLRKHTYICAPLYHVYTENMVVLKFYCQENMMFF